MRRMSVQMSLDRMKIPAYPGQVMHVVTHSESECLRLTSGKQFGMIF